MGVNLQIVFLIPKRPIDRTFLCGLVDVLKMHGCRYNKWGKGGYVYTSDHDWISEDEIDGDLNGERLKKAIETTVNLGEGAIDFDFKFNNEPWGGYLSLYPRYRNDPSWFIVEFTSSSGYFYEHADAVERFIELGKSLYEYLEPFVGYIFPDTDRILPDSDELNSVIRKLSGITFFSPGLIDRIVREKVLSAPAYEIEELSDGGILINICNNLLGGCPPWDLERVKKHLLK